MSLFFPFKDDTPMRAIRVQTVTIAIIAANVLAFLGTYLMPGGMEAGLNIEGIGFGLIPVELFNDVSGRVTDYQPIPEFATLLTYQFVHGGWMHIFSNMLIMWIMADNVEDVFGHFGFLVYYLYCGVMAGLVHAIWANTSINPLVGASGAIAGVMAAYVIFYPHARILVLFGMVIPFRIQAWVFVGMWIVLQFVSLKNLFLNGGTGEIGVAYMAHVGGFVSGAIFALLWRTTRPRADFQ